MPWAPEVSASRNGDGTAQELVVAGRLDLFEHGVDVVELDVALDLDRSGIPGSAAELRADVAQLVDPAPRLPLLRPG